MNQIQNRARTKYRNNVKKNQIAYKIWGKWLEVNKKKCFCCCLMRIYRNHTRN